jgi:hypothetical protein
MEPKSVRCQTPRELWHSYGRFEGHPVAILRGGSELQTVLQSMQGVQSIVQGLIFFDRVGSRGK